MGLGQSARYLRQNDRMSARKTFSCLLIVFFLPLPVPLAQPQENLCYRRTWLDEVAPIITKNEPAVFQGLQAEEDRIKFQSLFWRVRDATPGTAR
jgi:hypothetical protein